MSHVWFLQDPKGDKEKKPPIKKPKVEKPLEAPSSIQIYVSPGTIVVLPLVTSFYIVVETEVIVATGQDCMLSSCSYVMCWIQAISLCVWPHLTMHSVWKPMLPIVYFSAQYNSQRYSIMVDYNVFPYILLTTAVFIACMIYKRHIWTFLYPGAQCLPSSGCNTWFPYRLHHNIYCIQYLQDASDTKHCCVTASSLKEWRLVYIYISK